MNLRTHWNAVVIGAGPAGSICAHQLAKAGLSVLLVDKCEFPRSKTCGCCLSGAALDALTEAGLADFLRDTGAIELERLKVFDSGKETNLPINRGVALSRELLDTKLIGYATAAGATFIANCTAKITSEFKSTVACALKKDDQIFLIESQIVIVADGVSGLALKELPDFKHHVAKDSRIGAGVILDAESGKDLQFGTIYMCCHERGYAGLVKLEDGRVDVAIAIDKSWSQTQGGPAKATEQIFNSCGFSKSLNLQQNQWHGTDFLTRQRAKVAGHRIMLIGDSCGYTEPFTGEGMAWALWSGISAAEIITNHSKKNNSSDLWHESFVDEWSYTHSKLIGSRHTRSHIVTNGLKCNAARSLAFRAFDAMPRFADFCTSQLSGHQLRDEFRKMMVRAH